MTDKETRKINLFFKIIPGGLRIGVILLFLICIILLFIYAFSGNFSDASLVILLDLMRNTGSVLALFSLLILIYTIWSHIRKRRKFFVLHIILFFISGIFGAAIAILCNVILVLSS